MEFIEPDRSNYIVSAHKPNDEGVRDIGFVKGTFLDGRPYRLECWCMDELIMASVFFDERYLTAWKRLDFALLLELEGVLQFKDGPYLQAGRMKDNFLVLIDKLILICYNSYNLKGKLKESFQSDYYGPLFKS